MHRPVAPPKFTDLMSQMDGARLGSIMAATRLEVDRYQPWDKILHLTPPSGLTVREWWWGLKIARMGSRRLVPLLDKDGAAFSFNTPDSVLAKLHRIDQEASGQISISEEVTDPSTRDRYIINSLIEEAITSSQLEGAATTRPVAKEMIRSGRRPSTRDEQMILNNYRAMQLVRENQSKPLTPDMVCRLHELVTDRTLDNPESAGKLQDDDDERVRVWVEDDLVHTPPPVAELQARLQQMCDFANAGGSEPFVHPVLRAIILHFWLAFDHPFEDGNGRTSRAVFYWCMLRNKYWLAEYISISRIIKKSSTRYYQAFLLTESDDNDLTYFIEHQLTVLMRAIDELQEYLTRKMREVRDAEQLVRTSGLLNHRQFALLSHALRHSDAVYTFESHKNSHGVVYQTARTDLLDLERMGLLRRSAARGSYRFFAVEDLTDRLRTLE